MPPDDRALRWQPDRDVVEDFVVTGLRRARGEILSARALFAALERHCSARGRFCPSQQLLGRTLRSHGFLSLKEGRVFYLDVALITGPTSRHK